MKIPKCPKTISGNHKFKDTSYEFDLHGMFGLGVTHYEFKGDIKCIYCGLIDDRELKIK
jgi:hypothetical protein